MEMGFQQHNKLMTFEITFIVEKANLFQIFVKLPSSYSMSDMPARRLIN